MLKLKILVGVASDKGIKPRNEDFVGTHFPDGSELTLKGAVAAIADGMSGSEAGQQASQCCVVSFLADYYSTPDSWSVKHAAQKILSATNSWLYSQGQARYQSAKGMVSTLSLIVFKATTAHLFHIGDSRIYRLRAGNLEQLTRDHRVWVSSDKSYLNRAMGIDPSLEVDYQAISLELGDVFLMTTDGVHDFIDEKSMKKLLQSDPDLNVVAHRFIQKASDNNSDDNLTCQILCVTELPEIKEDAIMRSQTALPFPPPLSIGDKLDGYQIIAELHASKRTQIYQAIDIDSGETVVLKTPSILYDDDTNYIENFLHEEWAGKRLNHANILNVLTPNRARTRLYYVTEFLDGKTLREWIETNPKPDIKIVVKIIEQLVKGLQAFHRMEMLHQDLKPENVLIGANGVVKIIDFGSVKIAGIAEISPLYSDEEENVLGTLNYTAPESHAGQRGTMKSDLFSLGVIAYELLNGALPFGDTLPDKPTGAHFAKLIYVPSSQHNEMIPNWMDGAMRKATAINPALRYDTLSEFLYDFTHPNSAFLKAEKFVPLIERNTTLFWKITALLLLIMNLITLYQLV